MLYYNSACEYDDHAQSPSRELASLSPQIVHTKTASQLEAILTANGMKDIAAMVHRELVEKVEAMAVGPIAFGLGPTDSSEEVLCYK